MSAKDTKGARRSRWYPPHTKPVRVGWYDASCFKPDPTYTPPRFWWDGERWFNHINNALAREQCRYWRGLARKPRT
jgi:hypothetical protein